MQSDILFDNIYIGHSEADAKKLKEATFDIKKPVEDAEEEANKPKEEDKPKDGTTVSFKEDPVKFVKDKVNLFFELASNDPIAALKAVPEVPAGFGVLAVTLFAILLGGLSAANPAETKKAVGKAKESAVAAKDKVAEAVTTSTEKVQAEVNKRTTRSSEK